jgi:protein TonB
MEARAEGFAQRFPGRLFVALVLSAALHAALLLGVRVGQVERPGKPPGRLVVRLAQAPVREPPMETTPDAANRASEPRAVPTEPEAAETPLPPSAPAGAATPPSAAESAAQEPARPGMPEAAAKANTLDLPLPPDPTYYPARQVDEHPVLLSGGKPNYPEEAAQRNLAGEVIVLMLLNEHGYADEVSIIEVKPPGVGFEEAVTAWLTQARFKPAVRQGRAVKARVVYHVTFEP